MAFINGHKVYHSILVVEGGGTYTPVELLNTTLTEETATIEITSYNSAAFNCKEFIVQLDIPAASSATNISVSVKRSNNTYQVISMQNANLKTTTDSSKHTLIQVGYQQHGNIYYASQYGGQIAATSFTFNNTYNNIPMFAFSQAASYFVEDGTNGIKLTGLFPVGTVVKVWGEIKQ